MGATRRGTTIRIVALVLATVLAACQEVPVESNRPEPPVTEVPDSTLAHGVRVFAAECKANVRQQKVECGAPASIPGLSPDLIVGGQNQYVTLASTNVNYDGAQFTFDATVRNLIPQPMGTTDADTKAPAPGGVKVFLLDPPAVTDGSGSITVVSDGTSTFTNADQHYYQYNTVLDQYEVSSARTWRFDMPGTVNTFSFRVLVSAPVPYPDGYIDVSGPSELRYTPRQFAATVRSAVGTAIPSMPITWSVSDTTMAAVDPAGMTMPKRAGSIRITAESELNGMPVSGGINTTVRPIRRMWTGTAGTTEWDNNDNWSPAIAPVATDTAVITDSVATVFPVLTRNTQIGGLILEQRNATPATLVIGPWMLTASGDVLAGLNTRIDGSSGRLTLAGFNSTVGGQLPRVSVSGRYSLVSNLTVRGPLRSELGRIRNDRFRIRVNSQ